MIYGKGGPYGSSSNRRVIPLNPRVQPLIECQRPPYTEGYFPLREKLGMRARTMQRLMKTIADRAHISWLVTPHVLRHSFSVTAIQKDISLPALQRLLDHDRLTTTEIYLNLSPEDVVRELQAEW